MRCDVRAAAAQIVIQEGSWGRYEGQVNQGGECHGQGVYSHPAGYRYEGEFTNDMRHGHGTVTWPDGRVESGQWKDGRFLG